MPELKKRVIRCSQENAPEVLALVRRWPAMHDTVRALQAQGQFPGLRAITVTLEGKAQWVDQGLAAVQPSASQGGSAC